MAQPLTKSTGREEYGRSVERWPCQEGQGRDPGDPRHGCDHRAARRSERLKLAPHFCFCWRFCSAVTTTACRSRRNARQCLARLARGGFSSSPLFMSEQQKELGVI